MIAESPYELDSASCVARALRTRTNPLEFAASTPANPRIGLASRPSTLACSSAFCERGDLLAVEHFSVDVGRFDFDRLDVVGELLERLRGRDGIRRREHDAGGAGEVRFELLGQLFTGSDREQRVLDHSVGIAVLAQAIAKLPDLLDREPRVVREEQILRRS
jgi:hypothetical protein